MFTATVNGVAVGGVTWSIAPGTLGSIDASSGISRRRERLAASARSPPSPGGQTASTTITINLQTVDQGDPGWTATPCRRGGRRLRRRWRQRPGRATDATQTAHAQRRAVPPTRPSRSSTPTTPPCGRKGSSLRSFSGIRGPTRSTRCTCTSRRRTSSTRDTSRRTRRARSSTSRSRRPAWNAMAYSNGGEPVTISLVFAAGGTVVRALHRDVDDCASRSPGNHLLQLVRHGARAKLQRPRQLRAPVRRGHAGHHAGRHLRRRSSQACRASGATGNGIGLPRVPHRVRERAGARDASVRTRMPLDYSQTVAIHLTQRYDGGRGYTAIARRTWPSPRSTRTEA